MAQYSQRDIVAMQQDAIRRVQEMQRRAQRQVLSSKAQQEGALIEEISHPEEKAPEGDQTLPQKQVAGVRAKDGGGLLDSVRSFLPSSLQSALDLDNDKFLLILLILFLQREGVDTILILALLYLMI